MERKFDGIEYVVRIPLDQSAAFEQSVELLGGLIISEEERLEAKWLSEYTQTKGMIQRVRDNLNQPSVQESFQRLNGVVSDIVWNIVGHRDSKEGFADFVELSVSGKLSSKITDIFDEDLDLYHDRYQNKPYIKLKNGWGYQFVNVGLSPKQIRLLIGSFGLENGVSVSKRQLKEQEGFMTVSGVNQSIYNGTVLLAEYFFQTGPTC